MRVQVMPHRLLLLPLTSLQIAQLVQGTHYICQACGGFFQKSWDDAYANEESRALFGNVPDDQLVTICNQCFGRLMSRFKAAYPTEFQ